MLTNIIYRYLHTNRNTHILRYIATVNYISKYICMCKFDLILFTQHLQVYLTILPITKKIHLHQHLNIYLYSRLV